MPKTIIDGVNTYYEVHGKGHPLVLIQGFGGEHHAWFFQIPTFRKHFRLVIIDNRGTGDTERTKTPYTIRTLADDVVALMEHVGIDSAHILGLSLGGLVAQEMAITYPQRVDKLVLGSTFAAAEIAHATPESRKLFGPVHSPSVDPGKVDFQQLMDFMVSLSFNRRLYRDSINLLRKIPTTFDPGGHIDQINAARDYSVADRLHLIRAPTLVITGSGDRIVPPENSEFLAARIAGARLVKVKGASHAFFFENSRVFNREVLRFLLQP